MEGTPGRTGNGGEHCRPRPGLDRGAGVRAAVREAAEQHGQSASEELDHDFLWRTSKALPERGRIGIFNRSHDEEVVALRVHPEWLVKQKLPPGPRGTSFWTERQEDINAFERHLDRSGTKIVKFFPASLDLSWPEVSEQTRVANAEARHKLAAEPEDETGGP